MGNIVSTETVGGYYVDAADVFTFDDGTRVTVTPDPDTENPCRWYFGTILCVYRAGYSSVNEDDRGDVLIRAFLEYMDRGEDEETALTLAKRYARTFHDDNRTAILGNMVGYSQSDWAKFIVVGDEAENLAETWEQWARGDVFQARTDDVSLGGIYAESAEDAAKYFHEDI